MLLPKQYHNLKIASSHLSHVDSSPPGLKVASGHLTTFPSTVPYPGRYDLQLSTAALTETGSVVRPWGHLHSECARTSVSREHDNKQQAAPLVLMQHPGFPTMSKFVNFDINNRANPVLQLTLYM